MALPQNVDATALAKAVGLDDADVAQRLRYVGFDDEDARQVRDIDPWIRDFADRGADAFLAWIKRFDGSATLFDSPQILERVRVLKRDHLAEMASGRYDLAYAMQRLELGVLYSHVQLDVRVFLGAYHHLMQEIGEHVIEARHEQPEQSFRRFMSLKKVAFFDIGLIVDVLVVERERVIREQEKAIRQLSTPILQVEEGVLVAPLVGAIDAIRARQLTEHLLDGIRGQRARIAVIDVTGVPELDTHAAAMLAATVSSARLMGARVILTGIASDVARSLVELGVDVDVEVAGDLRGGLERVRRAKTPVV